MTLAVPLPVPMYGLMGFAALHPSYIRIPARVRRNKRSALRRIVFEPSGINRAKVPIAMRPVTASPNPPV